MCVCVWEVAHAEVCVCVIYTSGPRFRVGRCFELWKEIRVVNMTNNLTACSCLGLSCECEQNFSQIQMFECMINFGSYRNTYMCEVFVVIEIITTLLNRTQCFRFHFDLDQNYRCETAKRVQRKEALGSN